MATGSKDHKEGKINQKLKNVTDWVRDPGPRQYPSSTMAPDVPKKNTLAQVGGNIKREGLKSKLNTESK